MRPISVLFLFLHVISTECIEGVVLLHGVLKFHGFDQVKDMPNARFIFPNQYWKVAQCPYECALGYYTDTSHQTIYPKCLPCGAPHVIGICSQENEDFCQCGTGIGYLGMSPQENGDMFTEVVVWNGQCQKF
jgi:hypothetical protein